LRADRGDVRERRYKHCGRFVRLVSALPYITAAAFGGAIERPQLFVIVVNFMVLWLRKLRASPCPRGSVYIRVLRNLRALIAPPAGEPLSSALFRP